jgi:hypothetical protein
MKAGRFIAKYPYMKFIWQNKKKFIMSCHHLSRRDFMSVAAAVPALALGSRPNQNLPAEILFSF